MCLGCVELKDTILKPQSYVDYWLTIDELARRGFTKIIEKDEVFRILSEELEVEQDRKRFEGYYRFLFSYKNTETGIYKIVVFRGLHGK